MKVTLYSTNCPKCKVLKSKLKNAGIPFTVCTDIHKMEELGILSVPMLGVDGELLDFFTAVTWINERNNT